ncbi:hypothetical protein KIPB_004831, partial [Kipferlia bialata]
RLHASIHSVHSPSMGLGSGRERPMSQVRKTQALYESCVQSMLTGSDETTSQEMEERRVRYLEDLGYGDVAKQILEASPAQPSQIQTPIKKRGRKPGSLAIVNRIRDRINGSLARDLEALSRRPLSQYTECTDQCIRRIYSIHATCSESLTALLHSPMQEQCVNQARAGAIPKVTVQDTAPLHRDRMDWLNDEVVNRTMELYLENTTRRAHCYSSFFYQSLTRTGGYNYAATRRWSSRAKVSIADLDVLCIPVNWNNTHWTCIVADFSLKCIMYYDSLGGMRPDAVCNVARYILDDIHDKTPEIGLDLSDWVGLGYKVVQPLLDMCRGLPYSHTLDIPKAAPPPPKPQPVYRAPVPARRPVPKEESDDDCISFDCSDEYGGEAEETDDEMVLSLGKFPETESVNLEKLGSRRMDSADRGAFRGATVARDAMVKALKERGADKALVHIEQYIPHLLAIQNWVKEHRFSEDKDKSRQYGTMPTFKWKSCLRSKNNWHGVATLEYEYLMVVYAKAMCLMDSAADKIRVIDNEANVGENYTVASKQLCQAAGLFMKVKELSIEQGSMVAGHPLIMIPVVADFMLSLSIAYAELCRVENNIRALLEINDAPKSPKMNLTLPRVCKDIQNKLQQAAFSVQAVAAQDWQSINPAIRDSLDYFSQVAEIISCCFQGRHHYSLKETMEGGEAQCVGKALAYMRRAKEVRDALKAPKGTDKILYKRYNDVWRGNKKQASLLDGELAEYEEKNGNIYHHRVPSTQNITFPAPYRCT